MIDFAQDSKGFQSSPQVQSVSPVHVLHYAYHDKTYPNILDEHL